MTNTLATALDNRLRRRWMVALAAVLAALTFSARAADCPGSPGGNPNQPGQCAGVGNPINVMTGNKYQREEDLPALPGVLGLEIVRHYNSAFSGPGHPNGPLGRGWRLSYETEVIDRWGKIQVLQADGGRVIFDRDRRSSTGCSTSDPANGSMAIGRQSNGQSDYTWTWTDGRKLHFNFAGKLDRITAPTGETVRLLYDSQNVLVRVIDPLGRSLNLVYYDRHIPNQFHGVQFIDTPVGRFAYEYGSAVPKGAELQDQRQLLANLVRVRLPDHFDPDTKAHTLSSRGTTRSMTSRIYHHEDARSPWLMTGISIESVGVDGKLATMRYSTYGYDDTGRAILSTHANNVDKVTLDNHEAGKTVLTNSIGQKTAYRYTVIAGEYRLLEVRGAGCALCGEPNVRYDYDKAGRLTETTKLSDSGQPITAIRFEHDKLGRVTRVGKVLYQRGTPGLAQVQVRYKYRGASFAPVLVARPSVVPGKELVTRIDYNEAGQPLSVSEAGWAPTADGKQATERIERTVRYRYATINGRSLLVEIDGPLPNGRMNSPADSDVTVFEYDHHSSTAAAAPNVPSGRDGLSNYANSGRHEGILTTMIIPGNRKSEVEYDYAGRIAKVKNDEGLVSSLSYSPRGQLLTVTRDGITHSTRYDALGHPIEAGYGDDKHFKPITRHGYDDAGRKTWTAFALGIVQTWRLDTEDQLLEKSTLSSTIKQTQRYEYGHQGRLQAVSDANGGTRRIDWNVQGLPDALTDALGRVTRFGYDTLGNITAMTKAGSTATRFELDLYGHLKTVVAPNGATTRYMSDDFGRVIATIGADSGATIRRFDAADRLVASVDANGNRASYEYDTIGRIVRQSVTDAGSGKQIVTSWRYEGTRLIAIDHPDQAERYDYDKQGRFSAKTITLQLTDGAHASTTTRYRYDVMGKLASIILPDGSMLEYRRNGQNQITALERIPACRRWLCWLLPRQTIVKDLERDAVGLKHLTYGNGIEAYYQRSKEGSLARIVYRDPRLSMPGERGGNLLAALLGVRPALAEQAQAVANEVGNSPVRGTLGLAPDPQALLDYRYLWDVQGNLLLTRDRNAVSTYAYDTHDRLIAAATGPSASFVRYHYDDSGNRLLTQEGLTDHGDISGNTVTTSYLQMGDRWQAQMGGAGLEEAHYDAEGQTERIGNRSFAWNATGNLLEVRDGPRVLARYRYNHRGERIEKNAGSAHTYYLYEDRKLVAELDGKGALQRQYVYLAEQPVAVIDAGVDVTDAATGAAPRGFMTSIANLWRTRFGQSETISYLHNNHLGATEMVTDTSGKPIWQTAYSPFGKLMRTIVRRKATVNAAAFELNLRLPGQYADSETGLYYNDHRYYDPDRGRYLTPDPLGLHGGSNAYAYVNDNPLKYVDPQGLILFAFDGTGNSEAPPATDSISNVRKFLTAYDEKVDGPKYYITGIGTTNKDMLFKGSIYNGDGFNQRVALGFNFLDSFILNNTSKETLDIDVIGFSRGAAEARAWINQLVSKMKNGVYTVENSSRCINLRFEGLWDTVPHLGAILNDESKYDFGIPSQVKYAVHAVALNEHRGGTTHFNGRSIFNAPATPNTANRIEIGFIGSHADIGGGYGTGDLSDAALMWIIQQAKSQGIKFDDKKISDAGWDKISSPILHDKSHNNTQRLGDPPSADERQFVYGNGKSVNQADAIVGGNNTAWARGFVSYYRTACGKNGNVAVGQVDMARYSKWLASQGVTISYTGISPTPLCD